MRVVQGAVSWFMLGLAAGLLAAATISFSLHGQYGLYYLTVGGACAFVSVAVALATQKNAGTRQRSVRESRI